MVSEQTLVAPSIRETSRSEMGVILTMLVATFVVILNETIMNVAIPELMAYFQVTATTAQWLTTSYMLTMAVLIPTTGFLIQTLSTRTLFLGAMGVFMAGTIVAGFAPLFGVLVVGRVMQASGTAIMLPLLMTTILGLIPPHRRGAMMGTVSIVISVAPATGPTISGIILQNASWRFLFFFVVPIALVVWMYGARHLRNIGERRPAALDIASVLLSGVGFGGLVFGFSSAGEGGGWSNPLVPGTIAVGLVSLALFVWRQVRLAEPLLNLRALSFPMFRLSAIMVSFVMMALFASALLLPIFLQTVRQFNPLQTGLLLLPGGVLMGVASPFIGRIFDRHGPRVLVTVGSTLLVLTLLAYTTLNASTAVPLLLVLHMSFSSGLALLMTPLFTNGLNQLPRDLYSHGSAISSTLQQVAGAVGTAMLVTVMSLRSESLRASRPELSEVEALTSGLHSAFAVAAAIATLVLVLSLFVRRVTPVYEDGAPFEGAVAH